MVVVPDRDRRGSGRRHQFAAWTEAGEPQRADEEGIVRGDDDVPGEDGVTPLRDDPARPALTQPDHPGPLEDLASPASPNTVLPWVELCLVLDPDVTGDREWAARVSDPSRPSDG
jgi:hypothetical protein